MDIASTYRILVSYIKTVDGRLKGKFRVAVKGA